MSMHRQSKEEFQSLAGEGEEAAHPLSPPSSLTVKNIDDAIAASKLQFDDPTLSGRICAAIRSGKHLLLQGPPGTGKTELAIAVARAAQAAGLNRGYTQIAGSSDWTPAETVGTYRLTLDKDLKFSPGLILEAIDKQKWVVLDEMNRAAIDQAMGSFFTVLSGQAVVLRYEEEDPAGGPPLTVAVVPEHELLGGGYRHYEVSGSWRIIATMNVLDVDLLFEVSQAFLRRFMTIDIAPPKAAAQAKLLAPFATGDSAIDAVVKRLTSLPGAQLGPAITIDCARFAKESFAQGGLTADRLARELFSGFLRPQLVHLTAPARVAIEAYLKSGANPAGDRALVDDEDAEPDD